MYVDKARGRGTVVPVECLQTTDVHAARRYGCGSVQLHSPRRSGAEVSFRARFHRSFRRAARHRQRHLPWSGLGLLPTAAPIGIAPLIAQSGQAEAEAKATGYRWETHETVLTDPSHMVAYFPVGTHRKAQRVSSKRRLRPLLQIRRHIRMASHRVDGRHEALAFGCLERRRH